MTVKELMEFLEKYPDDLRVVVNGYEDGYDDISPNRIFTRKNTVRRWKPLTGKDNTAIRPMRVKKQLMIPKL